MEYICHKHYQISDELDNFNRVELQIYSKNNVNGSKTHVGSWEQYSFFRNVYSFDVVDEQYTWMILKKEPIESKNDYYLTIDETFCEQFMEISKERKKSD